jgi:hypothetical protein
MSLRYCSLHKRLFGSRYHRWADFPQEKIEEIRGYYELLRLANTDASYLEVIETSCDQCAVTLWKIAQIHGKKDC